MPPLLPGRFAARVDEDIDPYKRTKIRTAPVGRHALMPPLLPGRFAARVDEDIDPYK